MNRFLIGFSSLLFTRTLQDVEDRHLVALGAQSREDAVRRRHVGAPAGAERQERRKVKEKVTKRALKDY